MGSRLRELRNSAELTRKELATKTKITDKTIQNYENKGIFKCTPQLVRLARFFNVDVNTLIDVNVNTLIDDKKDKTDIKVSAFDKNGNELSLIELALIVEENFENLKKIKRIKNLIDIETLKILLKAKKGDKFDIDSIL